MSFDKGNSPSADMTTKTTENRCLFFTSLDIKRDILTVKVKVSKYTNPRERGKERQSWEMCKETAVVSCSCS